MRDMSRPTRELIRRVRAVDGPLPAAKSNVKERLRASLAGGALLLIPSKAAAGAVGISSWGLGLITVALATVGTIGFLAAIMPDRSARPLSSSVGAGALQTGVEEATEMRTVSPIGTTVAEQPPAPRSKSSDHPVNAATLPKGIRSA